ncbi:MAG: transcriptional repressor [Bacillota bacterium]|jgi:Fur family peroxide stress response transcriptional regulator|nr:transcriptional repressor [Bacillota bacterium]NLL59437.1 transcriptional repressor [Tissierellia bacterium]
MKTLNELSNELKKKNIRLTHQRLKILEYLYNAKTHPTVEEIYSALKKEVPSLSKTTIYNTLNYLSELNIIKSLIIDENEARFDGVTDNHGHFKCSKCGKIYDFDINMDALAADRLDNFEINEKTVYFKGICSGCLSKI